MVYSQKSSYHENFVCFDSSEHSYSSSKTIKAVQAVNPASVNNDFRQVSRVVLYAQAETTPIREADLMTEEEFKKKFPMHRGRPTT